MIRFWITFIIFLVLGISLASYTAHLAAQTPPERALLMYGGVVVYVLGSLVILWKAWNERHS